MAKGDFKEHSKYKWGQLVYDHSEENFSDFLKTPENFATQAFADRAAGFVETSLFGMLPIESQHEVSTAGKTDARDQNNHPDTTAKPATHPANNCSI